MATFPHFL